jgi:hypothetical protein
VAVGVLHRFKGQLTLKKKLQVFVSSTYLDMRDERQAAVEAILRARHIPAGMELFASGDESQWDTIRKWIDDSDVFMLILGGRYGSIEPKSEKSYIQLEYEYAIEKKKPHFAALIREEFLDAKVKQVGADALERIHGKKLIDFKSTVTKKICRSFGDINELKLIVFESLSNFAEYPELPGWVRGSDVVDPKATLEEVNRLQTENAALRQQLDMLEAWKDANATLSDESLATRLSKDAKELLVAASQSGGRITYLQSMDGSELTAGDKDFLDPCTDREEARWKAALGELSANELLEDVGYSGVIFRLTDLGYRIADEIGGQKHSGLAEVTTAASDQRDQT